jgi:hypothetical protein
MKKFVSHDSKLDLPYAIELYLDEVRDNKNGLVFLFSDPSSKFQVEVKFDSQLMYRVSDESYRLKRTSELPEFSFVMKADESSFIDWFHEESLNIYTKDRIHHFLILSSDDVIDVLSYEEPSITLMKFVVEF